MILFRIINKKIKSYSTSKLWFKCQSHLSSSELSYLTPEAVFNDKVKEECIKRLKLVKTSKKNKENTSKAAVLVPLCIQDGKVGLLYTLRSNKVSLNRGQVSFPGGKKDNSDATLEDTAVRETWEELGIPKEKVQVWGTGYCIERPHVSVMPVLAYIGELDLKKLKINTHEVEEAFVQPLEKLCDPQLCRYTQFRNNYTLPTYLGGSHKIWGLTAMITHIVMSALLPGVYKHKLAYLKSIETAEDSLRLLDNRD